MNPIVVLFQRAVKSDKAKTVRNHVFVAAFLLIPQFAPMRDIGDLAAKWVGYIAIVVGGIILWVGTKALLSGGGFWSKLADIVALVFGGGLLVEGGLRVFTNNSLGKVIYNLLTGELGS